LQHALNIVGFNETEQYDLFRIVAAILHIGNIVVTADRSEQAYIRDNSALEKVCHLLGLPIAEFTKALLRPRVKAGREWVTQARTKKQVDDEMGALCKAIYEKSFGALVDRINKALDRPISKSTFIGVLDIAGFEIFETNGFEQLCINYTNEKLQQFFNHHMFVLEQEEYARENIDWEFVNFGLDLQPTIDLIESTSPIGILSCLDEECIMPKASDATFTEKLHQLHEDKKRSSMTSPILNKDGTVASKTKYTRSRFAMGFSVTHYAGKVEYRTDGWLDKNKDPLNANITSVLANSSEPYVAALFEDFREDEPMLNVGADSSGTARAPRRIKKGAFRTVAQRHKEQLGTLMAQLRQTQPHFVRCIVPNENKKPGQVNVPLVLDQLRCNGVLEGIRIARLGYPNRLPFVEFRQRYELLTPGIIPKGYMDGRQACQKMTKALDLDPNAFRIGLSKIFFKAGVLAELEEQRDELLYDVFSRLQASCRRHICQRRARKQLNRDAAVRTIQRNARIYLELKAWPWWMLYTKVRPLLAATRTDEALKRKEAELLLAKERSQRDVQEKQKLEELKASLETERRKVQEALDSERALNVDKDTLLARSKEHEAELEEELAAVQADLDTLDSQLERALEAQQAGESRYNELLAAFQEATDHIAKLESNIQAVKITEDSVSRELEAKDAQIVELANSKSALSSKVSDLSRAIREKEEDHERAKKRLQDTQAELQGKLSIVLKEKERQSERANDLEKQHRQAESTLVELKRKIASDQSQQQRKEEEFSSLKSQLVLAHKAKDTMSTEVSQLKVHSSTLEKELRDATSALQRDSSVRVRLQDELDQMRMLLATKSTEDVKQKEMASLRERELSDLRSQVSSLTDSLSSQTKRSAKEIDSLTMQVSSGAIIEFLFVLTQTLTYLL
jgi:myosin protein heavy chain